jgi:hypothetical protein
MKNIHVLPTPKPSTLIKNNLGYALVTDEFTQSDLDLIQAKFQNISITNDEQAKEGDWCIDSVYNEEGEIIKTIYKKRIGIEYKDNSSTEKKIILTTDVDLIKDGVQAIDEEFLEWFVKNPSCEEVEVESWQPYADFDFDYKIIIPKEEPKQKTLKKRLKEWFEQFKKKYYYEKHTRITNR